LAPHGLLERYQESNGSFTCERQRIRKKGKDLIKEEVKKLKSEIVKESVEIE